jgi:hypothetical protein
MAVGLSLQTIGLSWIAAVSSPTVPYAELAAPFVLAGIGMALFFAPVANVILAAVRREEERQALRATPSGSSAESSALPCSPRSSRATAATARAPEFVDGLAPAIWIGLVASGRFRRAPDSTSAAVEGGARPGGRRPDLLFISAQRE